MGAILNWPAIAIGAQFAATMAWLSAAWHFAPSLVRVLWSRLEPVDREDWHGSWWCAVGIVNIGYMLRWLIAGQAATLSTPLLPMWAILNLGSTGIACGVISTLRTRETKGGSGDVRKALILWFMTVLSCVAVAWGAG